MKKYQLPCALLMAFLFSVSDSAQRPPPMVCIADKQVTTASTQIAVQIPDNSPITKIRLNSETDGKSTVRDVSADKSFLMTVELADGDNSFNIIAYAGNKIVYSTPNPIVIVRKKVSTAAAAEAKDAKGKKLRLLGKGKVENQQTYEFEIDASEMPPQVGIYSIEIVSDNKGKKPGDSETRTIEYNAGINRQKQLQSVKLNLREGVNIITVAPRVEGENLDGRKIRGFLYCLPFQNTTAIGIRAFVISVFIKSNSR